jgi:glycerol-3-phosphate dehydrogenase (NAD(P)+)
MINNKKQKGVAIIGTGEIGSALEFVLNNKGIIPDLWDRDTKKLKKTASFTKVINNAQIIFLCVPSWANREIAGKIYDNIKNHHKKIVITLSKGIEDKSLKTMEMVLKEELKNKVDYGILVGPMIAEEIKSCQLAAGIIGLSHKKWQAKIEELFHGSNLKIRFSDDFNGLAICSVLKNIYSLVLGMADGCGFGVNVKSYLTVESYQEMKKITEILGGKKETVEGLAGLGDLLATGWSNFSHNFTTGRNIILKNEKNPRGEGCVSIPPISKLLGSNLKKFKILYSLKQIILEKKDAQKTLFKIWVFRND